MNSHDFNRKYLVNANTNDGPFYVGAEIGIGLKKIGTKLYLQPFINSWIYSVGGTWRYLTVGFGVRKITFNPAENTRKPLEVEIVLILMQ